MNSFDGGGSTGSGGFGSGGEGSLSMSPPALESLPEEAARSRFREPPLESRRKSAMASSASRSHWGTHSLRAPGQPFHWTRQKVPVVVVAARSARMVSISKRSLPAGRSGRGGPCGAGPVLGTGLGTAGTGPLCFRLGSVGTGGGEHRLSRSLRLGAFDLTGTVRSGGAALDLRGGGGAARASPLRVSLEFGGGLRAGQRPSRKRMARGGPSPVQSELKALP